MSGVPRERHDALYSEFLDELARTMPNVRIVPKAESRLNRVIDKVLRVVTFGGQRSYLSTYTTTLGNRIYVPECWERLTPGERYLTLRHELVHVRQFRRLTWSGITLLYVLLPLPFGFAAGRAALELEAYRETLRATWQLYGPGAARSPVTLNHIVERFTGPDYGWMWLHGPSVRRALERTLDALEKRPPPPL